MIFARYRCIAMLVAIFLCGAPSCSGSEESGPAQSQLASIASLTVASELAARHGVPFERDDALPPAPGGDVILTSDQLLTVSWGSESLALSPANVRALDTALRAEFAASTDAASKIVLQLDTSLRDLILLLQVEHPKELYFFYNALIWRGVIRDAAVESGSPAFGGPEEVQAWHEATDVLRRKASSTDRIPKDPIP